MSAAQRPRRGHFWLGVDPGDRPGPMFVSWERAPDADATPIVLIHGGGQGTDWWQTLDGRPGWAAALADRGHPVYVVDRPGHGRSGAWPRELGATLPAPPAAVLASIFTPAADAFPGAERHTRWTGGEDALRQVAAAATPMPSDIATAQCLDAQRCCALLERIGPAVLITHSAGAPAGWLTAAARPDLVRAVVAVEPMAPPYLELPGVGPVLPEGLTAVPLDWSVLSATPVALVAAQASRFRLVDERTLSFLLGRGCRAELLRLEDHGVLGNGHGVMLESNHLEALMPIVEWISSINPCPRTRRGPAEAPPAS